MKSTLLLPILAIGLSLNTAFAKSEAESPEVSAALATLEAKNGIEIHYKFCRARAGDQDYKYDYVKYIWELKNRPYIALSEQVFKNLPASSVAEIKQRWTRSADDFLSVRASADSSENGRYCAQHFSQILGGSAYNMADALGLQARIAYCASAPLPAHKLASLSPHVLARYAGEGVHRMGDYWFVDFDLVEISWKHEAA